MAGNSRKAIKDISKHFVLIIYILRILTEIDVARTTKAFSTSVKPVEKHSVTEPVVSIEETDEHMVSLCDGANRNDESRNKEMSTNVKKTDLFGDGNEYSSEQEAEMKLVNNASVLNLEIFSKI
ncbi:hypothetical protein MtrunA17_Chr6g0465401 [Medicago truncatula]|uniref:Uncharacterized protein n=1 Tax=Medicago truncatula TaxID=3880 RepID=G7KHN3_MEDTR|nr:hypothetical protein MTR_6g034670 [Medicago truncatula]RHN51162.1 hypothetical protein MtrunA17_Chr6g0465401 [Medicago truncatula]